jgi:cysteine desulfurase/selenocysteine lyase
LIVTSALESQPRVFDVAVVRRDFPILERVVHGHPLVYLDNAATTQKPRPVIDAVKECYEHHYSNVHRGVHQLAVEAGDLYEEARVKVQRFVNAPSKNEIIFVRGTTEAINLVARGLQRSRFRAGDEVLISHLEHHSNIVPWQLLREEMGLVLKVAPVSDSGEIILERFADLLSPRTKLVSVGHVSNALGTVNPVKAIIGMAHSRDIPVLLDGAQGPPHLPVDLQDLDCDFYAFSSHKLYGPSGLGVLYGRTALLEEMPPYQGGGDMILSVTFPKTVFNALPYKFEAGTPHIAGVIGLGAAVDYVSGLSMRAIAAHEESLLRYATERVGEIPGVRIIGNARERAGVLSFVVDGVHPHDVGTVLDYEGVAIRAGHHCAQPVMDRFSVPATCRASFGLYNTRDEVDVLVRGIGKAREMFS